MRTFLQKFFIPTFFLLFLFSFFLIEGDYRFYLFALWSLFLLLFNFLGKVKQKEKSVVAVRISIVLSLFFVVSTFFSTHLPLSLEKLFFYLIALGIFIFFVKIPKNKFDYSMFFSYLALVSLILNLIVLFFTFYTPEPSFFPGMNLLIRNYGHNHYAAYLLLVVPIFWWQLLFAEEGTFFSKKETQFLSGFLLVSSYLLFIFSLARLAIMISALQIILIFLINKKSFFSSLQSEFVRIMVKVFIFTFLSISLIFLFLSLPIKQVEQANSDLCPLLLKRKELCKPLTQNVRFAYWQKALYVIKNKPLFGSGLKTFNFSSRQLVLKNYQTTSYAHNIFLHNLAETGVLTGGLFLYFICYLFYRSFKAMLVNRNERQSLDSFLWLAATASLVNAMFDFDWNFFIIFVLSLIFFALILQNNSEPAKKDKTSAYFFILAIFASVLGLLFFCAEILQKNKRSDLLVKFFPYLNHQMNSLESAEFLSTSNYQNLHWFYRNDPIFIYSFATAKDTQLEKRVALQIELARLDPEFFIKNAYFGNLNYLQAAELTVQFMDTAKQQRMINDVYFLDYWRQLSLSKQFFDFANQAYLNQSPTLAAFYYQQAIFLDPHIMGNAKPAFLTDVSLTEKADFDHAVVFLQLFKDFNPESIGAFYEYMGFYENALIYLFQNNRLDDFYVLAEAMFKQQPNFSWFLWKDLTRIAVSEEDRQKLLKIYQRFQTMTTWNDFLPALGVSN